MPDRRTAPHKTNDSPLLARTASRITKSIRVLMQALADLTNDPEDEAAYDIMYEINTLAKAMERARYAGSDDRGNDVLDAHEAVANAIRAAKEDTNA